MSATCCTTEGIALLTRPPQIASLVDNPHEARINVLLDVVNDKMDYDRMCIHK
ncbi:MAG: hypothetical protein QGG48_14210 [Desulfatiglandales bacterium]|nr:hypothetical protein [Desulfatiglandales bacterium]